MRIRRYLSLSCATVILALSGLAQKTSSLVEPPASGAPPELVIQTGHSSRVTAAVFGPDNRWVASGSADSTIRLWDVESGRELRALEGHKNWIKSLALSGSGEILASGSNDHSIKLWNVSTGRELATLSGHSSSVEALAFAGNDRWLASGGNDGVIKLWDVTDGREARTLKAHTDSITSFAFSRDGRTLASGSADNSIKVWDLATGLVVHSLIKHSKRITSLTFTVDGKRLVSGSADGNVVIWDYLGGQARETLRKNTMPILTTFASETTLAVVSADGSVVTWNAASGKEPAIAEGNIEADDLVMAAFSRDGKLLASSTGNRLLEIKNGSNGKLLRTLESRATGFFSVAFSRDNRWLATGTNDRSIRIWQTATGREMPRLSGHTGWVKSIAFSPDSRVLASASNSGEVKLWDSNTGKQIYGVAYPQERLHTIAFSTDGKLVASGGTGQTLHLLDLATKQTRKLDGYEGEITGLVFVPGTAFIASSSTDKTVQLWDTNTGSVAKRFAPLTGPVHAIASNFDGTTLAAGTADGKVTLLKVATGEAQPLAENAGEIFSLQFNADGRRLATGGADGVVRIWDVTTRQQGRSLVGAGGEINGVTFTNDSQFLISGHGDGSMIVWDTQTGSVAATLVSVPLSDEWLVASPSGLFDGSPAAWKMLLWRFARNTFKVAPVESFFNEFYYPGLLADVLARKNPQAKQDIVEKDRRQPQIRVEAADTKAGEARRVRLKLEIAEAPANEEYSRGSGARDLRLFRNGLLVQTWPGDVLQGRARQTLEASVPIVAGKNDFAAYAFNRDNVKSDDTDLTITGAESLRRDGTAYLLVVGVGNYANPQYNLNYSVADATAVGQQLQSQQERLGRYRPIEVIPLLNEEATKANILLALRLLAGISTGPLPSDAPPSLQKINPAQPEDAVVFYFSGHGTAQDDRFYLIPHDLGYQGVRANLDAGGLASILSHSISDLELEESLKHVDADQLLLVIDACNSGQALNAQEERRGPMNTRGLAQLAYEKGMYILTASQSDEVAFESAGLKHSYLAYALIEEGIKSGAADADRNGQVFLKEWFDYATERVPRIGREKSQTTKELEEVDADEQRVQRPRVFNMRAGGAERFVVARLK